MNEQLTINEISEIVVEVKFKNGESMACRKFANDFDPIDFVNMLTDDTILFNCFHQCLELANRGR